MMFAAGMVIGAVCGVCIMCVVSYRRSQEYEAMLYQAYSRTAEERAYNAEERERYI